eukprot:5412734-Prymnesium_polylepis.1
MASKVKMPLFRRPKLRREPATQGIFILFPSSRLALRGIRTSRSLEFAYEARRQGACRDA